MKLPKEPVIAQKYTVREYQEFAVAEMFQSIPEHEDKADPKVGAILTTADGEYICKAHRGELRSGDHAEFTILEKKCRDKKLDNCIVYATLEPCAPGARKAPKLSCSERLVNARIQKVYIGVQDPDPLVKGKGESYLRSKNIEIDFFHKDLQTEIMTANEDFMQQAVERARKAEGDEFIPIRSTMEIGLANYDLTDLSEDALQMYINKLGIEYRIGSDNFNRLLLKWDFIQLDNDNVARPTGWGLLLFGKKPTDKYSQARIKFTVTDANGTVKPKDFSDALVKIPTQIEEYLSFVFPSALDRSRFENKGISEISIQLLREAIINAIVHRDYSIQEAQILIDISPKEIVIKSPGLPIVELSKLQNFTAPTVSRNPKLADVFYNMGYIERRGFGMEEIKKYKPTPKYNTDEVYTTLSILRNIVLTIDEANKIIETLKASEREGYDLMREIKLINTPDFAARLNIDEKKAQRTLKALKDVGLITSEGKAKSIVYVYIDPK